MQLVEASALAIRLMEQHGLLTRGWTFEFDRARKRFGVCNYTYRRIQLSAPAVELNAEEQVRDTILHEIAHALAGPAAGHGWQWRSLARSIGCTGDRCADPSVVVMPRLPWRGVCPAGHERFAARKPRVARSCGACRPRVFDARFLITWTREGQ